MSAAEIENVDETERLQTTDQYDDEGLFYLLQGPIRPLLDQINMIRRHGNIHESPIISNTSAASGGWSRISDKCRSADISFILS